MVSVRVDGTAPAAPRCAYEGSRGKCDRTAVDGEHCQFHARYLRGVGVGVRTKPESTEEQIVTTCERKECSRPADRSRGDGSLCLPHWRGTLIKAGQARSSKLGKRASKPSAPVKKAPRANASAPDIASAFTQAVEALQLVETIGWDLARQLADRIGAS